MSTSSTPLSETCPCGGTCSKSNDNRFPHWRCWCNKVHDSSTSYCPLPVLCSCGSTVAHGTRGTDQRTARCHFLCQSCSMVTEKNSNCSNYTQCVCGRSWNHGGQESGRIFVCHYACQHCGAMVPVARKCKFDCEVVCVDIKDIELLSESPLPRRRR